MTYRIFQISYLWTKIMVEQRKTEFTIPLKTLIPIKFRRSEDHLILIASHAFWKERVCNAILNKETLDITEMLDGRLSDLGHWLDSPQEHPHVSCLSSYHDLKKRNTEFHIQAGRVAEYLNSKRYDAALRLTDQNSAFESASNAVIQTIFLLKKEFDRSIKNKSNHSS